MSECSKLGLKGVRLNHSKSYINILVRLIFVDGKVKNNLCSNITRTKTVSVRHRYIGQFVIFKLDHCKANEALKAINLSACNFAKHSPILICFHYQIKLINK